jgi:hypothetical protein
MGSLQVKLSIWQWTISGCLTGACPSKVIRGAAEGYRKRQCSARLYGRKQLTSRLLIRVASAWSSEPSFGGSRFEQARMIACWKACERSCCTHEQGLDDVRPPSTAIGGRNAPHTWYSDAEVEQGPYLLYDPKLQLLVVKPCINVDT